MENRTENEQSSFTPPRHWIGVEELNSTYWSDPKVREKRGQEFFEKPVELIDQLDRSSQGGMARRDFLTIMGASMAMASFSCARRPVHKIIPYVVQPEEIVPGVANYYASTSRDCIHGCGVLVKTREGRPIKLEGNPDHPVNHGKLCLQAQASVLNLYDQDRLTTPIQRKGSKGVHAEISWAEVDAAILQKMKSASRVRILTGEMRSDSTNRLIKEFLSGFSNGAHVQYDPLALSEVSEAQAISYGTAVIPRYRFDQAEVVLSLGSDFMGSGSDSISNAFDWAKKRKLNSKNAAQAKLSKMYAFESALTITGSNADQRVPVPAGSEFKIAMAIAHQLMVIDKRSSASGKFASVLASYKPAAVAEQAGIENGAALIKKIADDLWANRGKSIVVGGSFHTRTKDQLNLQLAVNLLNSVLENEGATIDGTVDYAPAHPNYAEFAKLVTEMNSGAVDVLIIYRSNPKFAIPNSGFESAVGKVPLVIAINDRNDETAQLAHCVLPDHHFLENWGDLSPRHGVYSLQQPAMAPMHSTRAFEDSLIAWVKMGGAPSSGLIAQAADWHAYLKSNWQQTMYKESGATGTFEQFWESTLQAGVLNLKSSKGLSGSHPTARHLSENSVSDLPQFNEGNRSTQLVLYVNNSVQDGRNANNPWLQELPDPISSATWDNYLGVSPALAAQLGLENDYLVEVKAGDSTVELPVYIQPGLHKDVAIAAVGYGRSAAGKVGDGTGVDVYPFVKIEDSRPIFSGMPVTISKTQKFYKLATTQWHTASENRPIISDVTLAEFQKNPGAMSETNPELKMKEVPTIWPIHEYKGYRWGMSIDLNSCTGCSACTIACQAENNVPVVGREQVRVARNMHWIRIDRYYSGDPANPEMIFQPMLCQHCENAPCETVCPVLATVHDDEGLNVQVYNRCVGTRYCQNNCPYKVRRFNFFDHWKSYEGTMNLVWNPDVTVRTRGIMEKCTFCVQRITDSKDRAKDRGDRVSDHDLKTACQQTCPTEAIVFGDMNNPQSEVSALKADQRAFHVLETLNTRPSISYMSKIRNTVRVENKAEAAGDANA
jgi:MoCo/4Fe-4S cofactor protein with predicted Tat translocation signal